MYWLPATVTALAVLVAFWLPGAAVLSAWGWRAPPLTWVAAAPVVSLGVLGLGALVLPWTVGSASLCVLAVSVPPLVLRLARTGVRALRPRIIGPEPRALVAVVAVAAVVPLLAVLVGLGRPDRLLVAHDAIVHLAGVAHIRTAGTGSSWLFTSVNSVTGQPDGHFYGAAWHDVAALVPPWPDAATAFNLALVLPTAICWTTGVVALTRAVFPARRRAHVWAGALSAAGLAWPVLLALRPEGMTPNAMGVAVVPVMVAIVHRAARAPLPVNVAVALVGFAGVGLTHPNAALACLVVLLPLFAGIAAAGARRIAGRSRPLAAASVAAALAVIAVGIVESAGAPPRASRRRRAQAPLAPHLAVLQALSRNATGMRAASGFVVRISALAGIVLAWRVRPARWALAGCLVALAWYLAATSSVPLLTDVDRPWYGEPKRFAPVLAAMLVPPAAVAIDACTRRLRLSLRRRGERQSAAELLAGALVARRPVGAVGSSASRGTAQPSRADERSSTRRSAR